MEPFESIPVIIYKIVSKQIHLKIIRFFTRVGTIVRRPKKRAERSWNSARHYVNHCTTLNYSKTIKIVYIPTVQFVFDMVRMHNRDIRKINVVQ